MSSSTTAIAWFETNAVASAEKFKLNTGNGSFVHTVLAHMPDAPCRVLDVGAGSGELASFMNQHGYDVTAVEPAARLRTIGQANNPTLQWVDDTLPALANTAGAYEVVLLNAVLMFLDQADRTAAYHTIHRLAAVGGLVCILNKYAPDDAVRGHYAIPPTELPAAAQTLGWDAVYESRLTDLQGRPDLEWRGYIYKKPLAPT